MSTFCCVNNFLRSLVFGNFLNILFPTSGAITNLLMFGAGLENSCYNLSWTTIKRIRFMTLMFLLELKNDPGFFFFALSASSSWVKNIFAYFITNWHSEFSPDMNSANQIFFCNISAVLLPKSKWTSSCFWFSIKILCHKIFMYNRIISLKSPE